MNENCKQQHNPTTTTPLVQQQKQKQQQYEFKCLFIIPVIRLLCQAITIVLHKLLSVYHFCRNTQIGSLYSTFHRHVSNTFPYIVHKYINKYKYKHKQDSSLSRIPVFVRVIQFVFGIVTSGLLLYVIGITIYWLFHHLQCYSREMNIFWDEGVAHSIYRNHTCPKPLYYINDDNLRNTFNNNTTGSVKNNIIIDPSRICITSLSDSSPTNNNKKVRDSFLSLLASFVTRIFSVRCRDFSSVEEDTWPITVQYCKKHGYTCFEGSHLLDTSRPPAWSKIKAVYYLLTNSTIVVQPTSLLQKNQQFTGTTSNMIGSCDWVLWMDADTIIMNSNVRIEDLLPISPPSNSVGTATSDTTVTDSEEVINLIVTYDRRFTANSGVWIIRNTYWSHQFLYNWWSMTNFVRAKGFSLSGDNQAFGNLLDTTYNMLHMKQQVQVQQQQQPQSQNYGTIENVDITNKIISGPIRMIPRCQMNSFGIFIPNNNKKSYKKEVFSNHTVRRNVDSTTGTNDINNLLHINSDEYYHYGDFIAHASGIDQKQAGVKLLLQHAIM